MRVRLTEEQRTFQQAADRFIAEQRPVEPGEAAWITFRERAIAEGFTARSLPELCGGLGLEVDPWLEWIWVEACRRANVPARPAGTGVQMLAPTLLEAGSDEQRRRFLLPALTGREIWAQGFSEPNAGSDLAALRTRATLDGNEWVIDGQKIWTTHAERAHFMFALVRTEPNAPAHRGISFLLVDLQAPGVTVRPIRQMTDEHEYCEVFLDGARAPAANLVGARGDGWRIANLLLKHERGWIGDFIEARFMRLSQRVDAANPDALDLRMRAAEIEGHVLAHRASALRRLTAMARGEPPSLIDHVAKLFATDVMERISGLAADLLGPELSGRCDDPWGDGVETPDGYWVRDWYWSMAYAVAGGASNIQRDVIASRGLGLPRAAA